MNAAENLLFKLAIPVRWGDLDAVGHVNNATYYSFTEHARVSWFASLGLEEEQGDSDLGPVVVHTACDYLRAIIFPATVEVSIFRGKLGRTSIETYYELRDQSDPQTLYATGKAVSVWVDHRIEKSVPVPTAIRVLFDST